MTSGIQPRWVGATVPMSSLGLVVLTALALCSVASTAWATVGEPEEGLPPGIGIRLLDVPTEDADDPRANTYIVDHVLPGGAVQRRLLVSNGTDEPLRVEMVPVEARLDDGWVVGNASDSSTSIASWIETTPSSFTLAPQSTFEVEARINIPASATPGERYAAIVAQPPATEAGSVDLISRVGMRVYLSVGGEEPETDFTIDTLTAARSEDNIPSVTVGVLNTGGRAIDVSGELEFESEDGLLTAGPFPTIIPKTLAPQSRGSVTVELPSSISAGPWNVTATLRSGLVERVATTTLTIPDDPGMTADPAESETVGGTDAEGNDISEELRNQRRTLLPLAAIMILLALGALWLMLMWKRRDEDEEEEGEELATTATGTADEDSS